MEPSPEKPVIALSDTESTMLVTVMMRAKDARSARPILNDQWAQQTLDKVEASYRHKFDDPNHRLPRYLLDMVATRALLLDTWTRDFLHWNKKATILHLACGLDSRCLRIPWRRPGVRWYDVDLPDVIALRRRLAVVPKPDDGVDDAQYTMLGVSVTDEGWLEALPNDRPVLLIMEGLTMYLPAAGGQRLLRRVVERFRPAGGEMVFDAAGCLGAKLFGWELRREWDVQVHMPWAIDGREEVERLCPGVRVVEALPWWRFLDGMGKENVLVRVLFWVCSWVPWLGTIMSMFRATF